MFGVRGRFYERGAHPETLLELAASSLAAGDALTAYRFADRFCRIHPPSAPGLRFRAEALRQLGFLDAARSELDKAARIDPTLPELNNDILSWGRPEDRTDAARRLLAASRGPRRLRLSAARQLLSTGQGLALQIERVESTVLAGWAVWAGLEPMTVEVETTGGWQRFQIAPQTGDDAARTGSASAVPISDVHVKCDSPILSAKLHVAGKWMQRRRFCGIAAPPPGRDAVGISSEATPPPRHVDVVVPVYADLAATRNCLDSVVAQSASIDIRILVVDDDAPDTDLKAYLDAQAATGAFTLLRNAENLGFVGAVNAAFRRLEGGDVLLLNSDAWLPPGAVERLRRAAYSDPRIGSAAPFSNHAELTSYPVAFQENPMPRAEDIVRLDQAFALANREQTIAIPSGTGFCLYIKRDCHAAVGPLSELYGPGYGEDIEWALAARERGFHHVCATDVYVGHAGSLSFQAAKRALVMRNLRLVAERFPNYSEECLAFMHRDPLRGARAAAERLRPPVVVVRLLVDASPRGDSALIERLRQLHTEPGAPVPLTMQRGKTGPTWEIRAPEGGEPQSLAFDFRDADAPQALKDYLGRLNIDRVEILGSQALDDATFQIFAELDRPVDVICSDAWPIELVEAADSANCDLTPSGPCAACASRASLSEATRAAFQAHQKRLWQVLGADSRIVTLDNLSSQFAAQAFKRWRRSSRAPSLLRRQFPDRGALGILAPTRSAQVDRLLKVLGRTFAARNVPIPILVLGGCLDDLAVMASGTVFVTGLVKPEDYKSLMELNGVTRLLSPYRRNHGWVFDYAGQVDESPPRAFFDWTFGAAAAADADLRIDSRVCDAKAAHMVAEWVQTQPLGLSLPGASE